MRLIDSMRGRRTGRRAAAAIAIIGLAACSGLLDVDNPNNIPEDALSQAAAAEQQMRGVVASTARMLSAVTTPYATATDELDWIGSRDAWLDLDMGAVSNYLNEFTDQAFPFVGEARYLGDQTIARLEEFRAADGLRDLTILARTYLYTAVTYSTIADMFDDFALSNKREGAPAIGRANMVALWDTAIVYLDRALPLAGSDADLNYQILATRARVKHGKAAWQKITPKGTVPSNPLVNDAGANADATAALAALAGPDDRFELFSPADAQPDINIWFEVNGRNEMEIGNYFGVKVDDEWFAALNDPVTGTPDSTLQDRIDEFIGYGENEGTHTITSDREMRLILAEAALAVGNLPEVATHINAVRALDGKPNWLGVPSGQAILIHERSVQLYMMRRRLIDLYRFGLGVAEWQVNPNFESAVNTPGLLFPIPNIERQANPCIDNPSSC